MKLNELCKRADLAVRLGATDYAIAVCQHVLTHFPKHVQARTLLGQALMEQGALAKAAEQFRSVLDLDPENVLARSALGVVYDKLGDLPAAIEQFERAYQISPSNADVLEGLRELHAKRNGAEQVVLKPSRAALARLHYANKQYTLAIKELDEVLKTQPNHIETYLSRAELLWRSGLMREAERACVQVLQKAPETLKAKLILAEIMMRERSREKQGLALLHEALAADPGGSLAKQLFAGTSFLLPDLADEMELPGMNGTSAPAEVETALALLSKEAPSVEHVSSSNVIDEAQFFDCGDDMQPKALVAPDVARVQDELERIAASLLSGNRPRLETSQSIGMRTAQMIVTSRSKLVAKYGEEGFDRIDRKLRDFAKVLEETEIAAKVIYVDDASSANGFGLSPVDPESPEQIRRLIDRLDSSLRLNGLDASYVLIVGGDSIVPFFRLSNPVQDDDEWVLSDNPYASRDDDFIIPERALGRMPDAEGAGVDILLAQLDTAIVHRHGPKATARPLGCLALLLSLGISVKLPQLRRDSFGYSTLVWQNASTEVYKAIGSPQRLVTSPPITDEVFDVNMLLGASFSYFNLHGAKDSENWYGQKDATYPEDYPMLPVALRPATVARAHIASSVVFTEACYGANVISRKPENAMALRFLADGALAFVGSTVTSYGVPAPPLSNADLLAILFWQHLAEGVSVGQALMKAKITFASETIERQGWLDGDDQKTLLEFVLYGDPSAYVDRAPEIRPKAVHQPAESASKEALRSRMCVYCKHTAPARSGEQMEMDLIRKAISHLRDCCPELYGASVKMYCSVGCKRQCSVNQCGVGRLPARERSTPRTLTHFVARGQLQTVDGKAVPRFARTTMTPHGEILKTTISR